jgi:gas vesicle protein
MFFAGGILCGVVIGAAVALVLAPASGETMREDAQSRFDSMMVEARLASERRRRELEAELAELTSPAPQPRALKRR